MNEQALKNAVYKKLLPADFMKSDTLVVDELGINHGKCRIDIAVINGHLRGIELKSQQDTLDRLPAQIESYSDIVDRATAVVDVKHTQHCREILPDWWGIIEAETGPRGAIHFRRLRGEKQNEEKKLLSIARLLWRNEALDLLVDFTGDPAWKRLNRADIYDGLTEIYPENELCAAVFEILKYRKNWRGHEQFL